MTTEPNSNQAFEQFVRFVLSGLATTALHFVVLHVLFIELSHPAVLANAVAFVVAASFSYCANYWFTFKSQQPHIQSTFRFMVTVTLGFILNALLMYFMVTVNELDYRLAFVCITGVVTISNFMFTKFWVFSQQGNTKSGNTN